MGEKEVTKIKKIPLNVPVKEDTVKKFKAYCKEHGIPINTILESFMEQFIEGDYRLKIVRENTVGVELK